MKYKVGDIVFSTIWEKSVLIKDIRPNRFYLIADLEYLSRTMVTYESNLKSREDDIEKDMEEHQKIVDEIMDIQEIEPIEAEMEEVWHCPNGYIFKDENGNVINTTKIVLEKNIIREEQIDIAAQEYIDSDNAVLTYSDGFCEQTDHPFVRAAFKAGVEWADNNVTQDDCSKAPKLTSQDYSNGRFGYRLPAGFEAKLTERELILTPEKPEYPKTFRECQECLGEDVPPMEEPDSKTHRRRQVHLLEVLLICRDAYWKIAGEEMGLGKPWEPDWNDDTAKYSIYTIKGVLTKAISCYDGAIFAFPTEEMRDAFKENFDPDIEICKEFL